MRIVVWNKKGGVGKTPLSFSLAKDFNKNYVTNEYNNLVHQNIYNKSYYKEVPDLYRDVIYDLGGFVSKGISNLLSNSDILIIPLNIDKASIFKTIETFKEAKEFIDPNNIIYVIGNYKDDKDFDYVQKALIKYCQSSKENVLPFKKSALYKGVLDEGLSFKEQYERVFLAKSWYKTAIIQYGNIINRVREKIIGLRKNNKLK